tara:strand:+ start:8627 stop:9895 length:1269 start_codon:yes stop_codon:yes gene_type:complete
MKEQFDEELAKKVRDTILHHVEVYEDGAWERFLTRKKKRKNRIHYWCMTGVASSMLLLISIGWILIKNPHHPVDFKYPVTIKDFPLPYSRILESTSGEDSVGTGINLLKESTEMDNINVTKVSDSKQMNLDAEYALAHMNGRYVDSKGKVRTIVAVTKSVMIFENALPIQVGDIDLFNLPFDNYNWITEQFATLKKDVDYKVTRTVQGDVEIGFQVSPSYGSNNANSQTLTSTNFGAGVVLNVPIKSSAFAFNTGIIFNNMRLKNEESILATSEASMEEDKYNKEETSLKNLDIPINIMYKIPSKRNFIFIQAGMSSYLTFNENAVATKTTFREVEVYHDVNGTMQSYRVKEEISSKKESDYKGSRLHPFGTINLSIGYKAPLSDRVKYEIQPFYKLPLNSISTDNTKVPMGGIALKVSLNP